ncbi:MAG: hypothetical protein JWM38_2638 [Sphingomonas bacterium]|nr:hypothetical protein [Sphingomonas bacterium]
MPVPDQPPVSARALHICFLFNAQRHQLLHGIATAVELARMPGFEVYVVSPAEGHVAYAREAVERLGGAPIHFVCARSSLLAAAMRRTGSVVPPKLLSLTLLARWLNNFDAIALPERTSIILKRMGVRRPRFIHLDHGAGDRAAGFDPRIRHFDFVLIAGPKHRERLLAERLVRPQSHAVVGYPKFDAADAMRDEHWRPFANDRPVILYNPHFSSLGSWERWGAEVIEAFAAQDRYNLIVAPHVRLLDHGGSRDRWGPLLDRYEGHPNIHIDRGSDRAIDMTYTSLADVYLGDVSSQVYEFLRRPRPCLFLNAQDVRWQDDENYAHWHFGPTLTDVTDLIGAVDAAIAGHGDWRAAQEAGFGRTFLPGGGAARAAGAIRDYLAPSALPDPDFGRLPVGHRRRRWQRRSGAASARVQRAAILVPMLFAGWMLHEVLEPAPTQASSSWFIDRAIASHQTTRLRRAMRSQPETHLYDPAEILRATAIRMPAIPAGWQVGDAQLFPSTAGHTIQLSLHTPQGEAVSLVAMRIETPAGATPILADRSAEHVAYWEAGDCAFALVGELASARLLMLASNVARPAT